MDIVYHILRCVADIQLPFGFSFGVFILFVWSVPLLLRFFKSIF